MGMAQYSPTHSGRRVVFDKPNSEMIDIDDIAHALSMICRFGGHSPRHYSVAEHCLLVASLVSDEYRLAALLHDASEAYVGDMVSPLKHLDSMEPYRALEDVIHGLIEAKFDVQFNSQAIKEADMKALYIEGRSFYGSSEILHWEFPKKIVEWGKTDARSVFVYAPSPNQVKDKFMNAFLAYGGIK